LLYSVMTLAILFSALVFFFVAITILADNSSIAHQTRKSVEPIFSGFAKLNTCKHM
jgi:hypothetical protein